jgi:tetratricopeptide (TPR) repeat protein
MLLFATGIAFGQSFIEAEKLVNEGVVDHDKGDYNAAIAKYDNALALDKDNLLALSEKAYSLTALQKYEEAIAVCQQAIAAHPGDDKLRMVYVTQGNSLDALKRPDESLKVYDDGIQQFPDFYLLYFNKGITLSNNNTDDALACFEKAVLLNPNHASSHNAIARLLMGDGQKIPGLLAYSRFLTLEPKSRRAEQNFSAVQQIMKGNVEERGKGAVTINISADALNDATGKGAPKENNFAAPEMILSMAAALDYDKAFKKMTAVQNFVRKFDAVCSSMEEGMKDNTGFFWEYYAPYFVEMKKRGFTVTFANIAFASSGDSDVSKWLDKNKGEIDKFLEWSKAYQWKSK